MQICLMLSIYSINQQSKQVNWLIAKSVAEQCVGTLTHKAQLDIN